MGEHCKEKFWDGQRKMAPQSRAHFLLLVFLVVVTGLCSRLSHAVAMTAKNWVAYDVLRPMPRGHRAGISRTGRASALTQFATAKNPTVKISAFEFALKLGPPKRDFLSAQKHFPKHCPQTYAMSAEDPCVSPHFARTAANH